MAADAGRKAADGERATRRQFFRVFGRQTVSGAGNVLAGVDALRRGSQDAIGELLGADEGAGPPASTMAATPPIGTAAEPDAPFRSPYRFISGAIEILDQRRLPERVEIVECSAASEVASAIRRGLLSGGPVLGQVAAYTLAMVAAGAESGSEYGRQAALRGAADTLAAARPTNRALASAIERVVAREAQGAGAVLEEADLIAAEAALDHGRLGALGAAGLAPLADQATEQDRPLAVLMHGDHGPLTGGQIGTGVAVLQSVVGAGRPVHAWLTEAAPLYEGRRAAWQLGHLDLPCTLVPDTALGWLLDHRRIDLLLLRAEALAANGDLVAPLGSLVAAHLARAAGVPVIACAPLSLLDEAMPDASGVPAESRVPAPDVAAGPRIDPAVDVVSHDLLDAVLTDEGELRPPYGPALTSAAASAAERHAAQRGSAG